MNSVELCFLIDFSLYFVITWSSGVKKKKNIDSRVNLTMGDSVIIKWIYSKDYFSKKNWFHWDKKILIILIKGIYRYVQLLQYMQTHKYENIGTFQGTDLLILWHYNGIITSYTINIQGSKNNNSIYIVALLEHNNENDNKFVRRNCDKIIIVT